MGALDISITSLLFAFLLLFIPIVISKFFRLGLIKPILNASVRMAVQLILIGIFLKYLFVWNNPIINILWLFLMIIVAVFTAVKSASIKGKKFWISIFIAFSLATLLIVFYLNIFVLRLDYVFDAKYLIVLGGMLLGNSLRGNIVGIDTFYKNIKKEKARYYYLLSLGASQYEAILPYLRESIKLAIKPTMAAMATIGIVSLPGMMTGVILGGAGPVTAIKYQMIIMVAILTSTVISVLLAILLTSRVCFDEYGAIEDI